HRAPERPVRDLPQAARDRVHRHLRGALAPDGDRVMHAPAAWVRGMDAVLRDADALLRRGPIPGQRGGRRAVLVVLLLAPLYGLCMGSYSVTSPDRLLMPVLIAAKMPILVLATAAICLPGFFVLYAAAGLASDFREALRAVAAGQAGVAAALASFGPVIL